MCSTAKTSSLTKLKSVSTSPMTKSELNSFVAVANACDARREERERLERERLALESATAEIESTLTANVEDFEVEADLPKSRSFGQLLRSVHGALTVSRSWGVTG